MKEGLDMKKIVLFVIAIAVFIPSICFANYFDQYPKRYIDYDSSQQYKSYLDIESVAVRRYDPPYYTIDITTYTFDYINQFGMVKKNRYFYDYKRQTISWQILNVGLCDEQGNIDIEERTEPLTTELIPIKIPSPGYLVAEFAFTKSYGMPFSIQLQKRLQKDNRY